MPNLVVDSHGNYKEKFVNEIKIFVENFEKIFLSFDNDDDDDELFNLVIKFSSWTRRNGEIF